MRVLDTVPVVDGATRTLGVRRRLLNTVPSSFVAETRTIDVVWTTGAQRTMFDWETWDYVEEALSIDPGAVRLDRLNAGAPCLDTHQSYELRNIIGVVVANSARIENGQGVATIQLSGREDIAGIVGDIGAGIIRNISVGYMVHRYAITQTPGERPLYTAVDWEPTEISFVPVPADAASSARSDTPQGGHPCIFSRAIPPASSQEKKMDPVEAARLEAIRVAEVEATRIADAETARTAAAAAATEATRVAEANRTRVVPVTGARILAAARAAGLDADAQAALTDAHAAAPFTERDLMAEIGTRFAARDEGAGQRNTISVTRDEGDTRRAGMSEALINRMDHRAALTDLGREYRALSLVQIASECLEPHGISTRRLAPIEIASRAFSMTSSDLPAVLANVMTKRLRMAYEENLPSYQRWAHRAPNARDFKPISVVQLSGMPDLVAVNEAGEIKYGSVNDGAVTYALTTFGRIMGVSRQMLINDDLNALDRWATGYAGAARRLENRLVYGQLTGAATYKGGPLFAAGNGNVAPAAGAISASTLGAGRTAMRLQKGLQAEELNLTPAYLITPATQEQIAYQYTSANYVPVKQADTSEFRAGGKTAVEPIVEAVLDGISPLSWYLVADSSMVDTIDYFYLDGAEGVQLSTRAGFEVDGMEMKALLDFGSGVVDYRGLWKNPGA